MFTIAQYSALLRGKPFYKNVAVSGSLSLPTEIQEGDTPFNFESSIVQGYPLPAATINYKLNGVDKGSNYVVQPGDAGKSLLVEKTYTNVRNAGKLTSNTATITAAQSFADLGYVGGNVESTTDYATTPLYRNAVNDGRGWGFQQLYGVAPIKGSTAAGSSIHAGIATLTLLSGMSYTMTLNSWTTNPLMGTSDDIGRIFTITQGTAPNQQIITATVTAPGTASGSATSSPNANTANCTVTLSAVPTTLVNFTNFSIPIAKDSNGWPMQKCEMVVTSYPGQLPGGQTYQVTVKSKNPALTISGGTGFFWNAGHPTQTNLMNFPGVTNAGITTYTFNMTFDAASSLILEFSDGVTFVDIPRDGSATSYDSGSIFNPAALAYYSQFATLRFMDFLNTNGKAETEWNTRTQPGTCITRPFSWEVTVDFCNALYEYPGSKLKQVWLNIGGLCSVAAGNSHTGASYVENMLSIINTWNSGKYGYAGLNSNLKVVWEYGNEPWNFAFNLWGQYVTNGTQELQMLNTANYGNQGYYTVVSGLTMSGGVATVNCTGTKPFFVTNGATMLCVDGSGYWQGNDGGGNQANLTSPCTISNVTTGVDGGGNPVFSFTYPVGFTDKTNSSSSLTGSASRWGCVFNLTSTLAQDQAIQPAANQQTGVAAFYNTTIKWMVRQAWRVKQILKNGGVGGNTRPNDRVVINLQQYATYGNTNGNGAVPLHFAYGAWLDSTGNSENPAPNTPGAISNWLYGAAIAPYVTANTTASWVGGSNQATAVATAAAFAVGDSVAIRDGNLNSVISSTNNATLISGYLRSAITAINGSAVTLADRAGANTAMAPGSNVMVMTSAGVAIGTLGVGVMYQGDNVVNFTTPIPGLAIGDVIAVGSAGYAPLKTTITALKAIGSLSINAAGTAYTNNVYNNVPLSGGTGTGATAQLTFTGGALTKVNMTTGTGTGYSVNDILTFTAASVGGTGSGGSIKVTGLTTIMSDFAYADFKGAISAHGLDNITVAGSGYTDGTYAGVPLTNVSSAGSGAQATVVIVGGVVTTVTVASGLGGSGYLVGDTLTAAASSMGGTGSGFQVKVTAAANAYAKATSGAALGLISPVTLTANNIRATGLSLAGLVNGDTVTIIGAGNQALYTGVTAVDVPNNTLTLAKTIANQYMLTGTLLTQNQTVNSTMLMTGVNPASVIKAMMINLRKADDSCRSHVTQCKLVNIHPVAYEWGPDTQCIPLWNREIHTYADATYGIGALVTALQDIMFQNGMEHSHFFTLGPAAILDASLVPNNVGGVAPGSLGSVITGGYLGQVWQACESFADTTNPKVSALINYSSPKWYQNLMSYPTNVASPIGAVPNVKSNRVNVDTMSLIGYQRLDCPGLTPSTVLLTSPGYTSITMVNFSDITGARLITYLIPVPRAGKYMPVVYGTDIAAGTQVQVLIDQVLQTGTQTLAQNGDGTVATAKPLPATGAPAVNMTAGVKLVQVNIPAGNGTAKLGIAGVKFVLTH